MSNIENSICEAIELIVDKSISEAGYDRTIQATIKNCVDASIGKYTVKYQDSSFYAFATSADVTYTNGSTVYVLIPGNDMSNDKTILGTVAKLGINYVTQAEGDEAYNYVGTNCISSSETYLLSSYRNHNNPSTAPTSYVEMIYDVNKSNNTLNLDITSLNTYIKESSSLICGARFRTSLNAEQQYQGDYGIIFELEFSDNATGAAVTRQYMVDVDNMVGDPYRLTLGKRQYGIFAIDGANFNRVTKIYLFTKDFPYHKNDNEIAQQNLFDIMVSDIEISGATRMSDDELDGCGISFLTPNGSFFAANASQSATLGVTAQVKIKGKLVDAVIQKIPFYWFKEDLSILPASLEYNKYGGRGWRCLNQYNIIAEDPLQVEWIPAEETYTVSINDATAKENKYKCAIVYDNTVYTKEITIKNLHGTYDISIVSDKGTTFYYDIGRPNLTCIVKDVNGKELSKNNFIYVWAKEDPYGNLTNLPEDVPVNRDWVNDYNNKIKAANDLEDAISAGTKFPNAEAANLQRVWSEVAFYDDIQMVSTKDTSGVNFDNTLHHVAISEITNFNKYKCSVYSNSLAKTYYGTATIILKNTLESEDMYTLIINNGTQVYKYNEYGVSPASKSLDAPTQIPVLSFSVYDNLGNQIDEEILKHCDIRWKVPIKNTLLQEISVGVSGNIGPTDVAQEYQYYSGMELSYKINNKYYYDKTNNNIELTVDYKGMSLTAHTNLTFIKEGESGTNGTEYTAKIVPNTNQTNVPQYPILTIVNGQNYGYLNFKNTSNELVKLSTTATSIAPFKVILYKAGEAIFSGNASGISSATNENIPVTISWEMLSNKYNNSVSDASDLTINKNNGTINYIGKGGNAPANIIKCTVYYGNTTDGQQNGRYTVTATLPIIKSVVNDVKYHINLKENTGFIYTQYTSDGSIPKFNSANPFEIEVLENINGVNEIVSMISGDHAVNDFKWDKVSSVYDFVNKKLVTSNDLIHLNQLVYTNGLKANQRQYKPASQYDGLCVTNAVTCSCAAGKIHIPIHFFLNKYGLSQLNGWDGNSIQIDNEGGFILSPQMGAGKKNTDNSFTGVLMGEVQEPNRTTSDTGVIGYNKGVRSFLLDAENGGALFGSGDGKIGIDPTQNKALLYSGNYWKNYNENGFPSNYDNSNVNNQGMLIDLTTPKIHFGSGNFNVDANGYITAKGGGTVAGWNIDDDSLFTDKKDSSTNVQISSVDFSRSINGTNREALRLALGNKFAVSSDGTMYAGDSIIGTGSNKITIGKSDTSNSAIYSGSKTSYNASGLGFYLGTDGFALGTNFTVNSSGVMTAKSGYIGNGSSGWTIKSNYLVNGSKISYNDSNNGVYIGTSGIGLGAGNFYVSSGGVLYAKSGTVGGWRLTSSSIQSADDASWGATSGMYFGSSGLRMGSTFSVNSSGALVATGVNVSGKITASSGTIGGWTINQSSITGGKVTLNSSGALSGANWSITAAGLATFKNINVTGGSVSLGGTTLSGGSGGYTCIPLDTLVGNSPSSSIPLSRHIENLAVDALNVSTSFTFQNRSVKWQEVSVITKRQMSWTNVTAAYMLDKNSKDSQRIFCTNLSSTSWFRKLWLLVGVGPLQQGEGE